MRKFNARCPMLSPNINPARGQALDAADAACLDAGALAQVESLLSLCPAHGTTPLLALPNLAREIGVASLDVKHEAPRFGLGSFKALGGVHAVIRLALEEARRRLGRAVHPRELRESGLRDIAASITVSCATAGNHGRSVAAGAKLVGCRSVIFVPSGASDERIEGIAQLGAEVRRFAGGYDDAVAEAGRISAAEGWTVVSDTSWPGYERIPRLVMQGYTIMAAEALRELHEPPSHIFLQAGVGGFAAAVAGHVALDPGMVPMPRIVVVEPARAACLFESHRAGAPIRIRPGEPTRMSPLECYEPSLIAWRILIRTAAAFMTIEEEDAVLAKQRLVEPLGDDPQLSSSESGAAGLAGLIAACRAPAFRDTLGLNERARILLVNTEGDPAGRRAPRPAEACTDCAISGAPR
ncbi:diaminopropionate ammonia-lyase [Rhizobiales bacterium GAS113]|nr:diaminopropionate ammonia-lyase [Rhizobiales bacterium GAS113]